MGRKQRLKQMKKAQPQAAVRPKAAGRNTWVLWLAGVAALLVLAVGFIFWYVQGHKAQFIQLSLGASCDQVLGELYQRQANFTQDESARMRRILEQIRGVSGQKKLDERALSQMLFVVKVLEEVIRDGQLQANELEKTEMLLQQAEQILNSNHSAR